MDISFHYKYDGGEKQGEKSKAHKLAPLTGSAVRATITSVGQSGAGRRTRCPPDTSRFGIITENSETESENQMKGTGSGRMLPQKIQFRIREKDGLWQPSFLRGFYSDKAEKERN